MKRTTKVITGTASDVKVVMLLLEGLKTKEHTGAELLAALCRGDRVCPTGTCIACPVHADCTEIRDKDWEDYLLKEGVTCR